MIIRKTYEAPDTIISDMCLFVGNKPKRISFYPISVYEGSHTGKGSMFVTSDKYLQDAIESCPTFGRQIYLHKEERLNTATTDTSETNAEDNDIPKMKEGAKMRHVGADEVTSLSDAREWLERELNADRKKVSNPKALMRYAAENGVVFDAL